MCGGDACVTGELAFFTTEHTEKKRRATEYGHYLDEQRAPRKILRGAPS